MLVHPCSIATTSGGTNRKYGKWTSAEEISFADLVRKVYLQCFLWTISIHHLEKIQFKVALSAVDKTLINICAHIVSRNCVLQKFHGLWMAASSELISIGWTVVTSEVPVIPSDQGTVCWA